MDDIPEGSAISVDLALNGSETTLIVLRHGEDVHAYHNICPHTGRGLDWAPGKFLVKDGILVCAAHGASFRMESGLCIGGPCRGDHLVAVPVILVEGEVHLAPQARS